MIKKVRCCHLEGGEANGKECVANAEWTITDPRAPMDPGTYSCSEHLAEMLSDENHVQHFPQGG